MGDLATIELDELIPGEQLRTFLAVADRILPGRYGPGAIAANVAGCLPGLWLKPGFAQLRQRMESGLNLLQSTARTLHQKDFAECSAAQRDAMLRQLQGIPHPLVQRALNSLVRITLMGFLCHPLHGGNREGIAWESLGMWFDLRGRAP
jgi:hypothetical protein